MCDHGRSGNASPIGASEGLPVEASARPGTELITPSSGSPATRAVLQLPHPSILCASVEARRLSFRVSPMGAQVAKEARSFTEIWFSCSRKLRSDAKARCRSRLAGKIDRNDDPISLNAMPVLPPPSRMNEQRHGSRSWPSQLASSTKGRGSSGPIIMSTLAYSFSPISTRWPPCVTASIRKIWLRSDGHRRPSLLGCLDVDPREGAA